MAKSPILVVVKCSAALAGILLHYTATAQTVAPSQVTPRLSPPVRLPEAPEIEPLPSDKLDPAIPQNDSLVTVGDVSVGFAGQYLSSNIKDFVDALRRKRVSLQQIIEAADALERQFHAQGYILTRVVFPPQTFVDDGTLRVEIIDGYIERIDSTPLAPGLAAIVEPRLKALLRKPGLRLADIERALLVANELPGARVRSALSQGRETGGVLLTVESDYRHTSVGAQIDNYLPSALGGWQFAANIVQNNLLGIGDSLYARVGGDLNFNQIRGKRPSFGYLGGGLSVPVGTAGSSLAVDAIVSKSSTAARGGVPAVDGRLTQAGVRFNVLPVLNRRERLGIAIGIETIRQSLEAADFGVELTRDDYRIARVSVLADRTVGNGRLAVNARFSAGLGGRVENMGDPSSPGLSRQGASPDFAKLDFDALFQIPTRSLRFDLTLRGQTGFGKAMLLSEQFSLDGRNAISTPVSGTFLVDSGQTARIEAIATRAFKLVPGFEPYLFVAQGYGTRARQTAVESDSVLVGATGVGARLNIGRIQLGAEFGNQVAREFGTEWSQHARLTVGIR